MTGPPALEDALIYANRIHANQRRRGSEVPYISHPLSVAALVMEMGGDEIQTIGALLHDAAEDQGGRRRLEEIRERFGARVAQIVEGCSDDLDRLDAPWRERKERYLGHLEEADPDTLIVSLADKLHNARCLIADFRRQGEAAFRRFTGGPAYASWYVPALAEIFRRRRPGVETDELLQIAQVFAP